MWYRRKFTLDEALKGGRVLLHFGAVDYEARVWVNGKEVAHHRGGYTPFSADITSALADSENEIVVYAVDDERGYTQPLGKQSDRLKSYGCSYTRTTGIWQTVWLEAVGNTYISGLTVWPNAANGCAGIEIDVAHPMPGLGLKSRGVQGRQIDRERESCRPGSEECAYAPDSRARALGTRQAISI